MYTLPHPSALPDELLQPILDLLLAVPDSYFFSTSESSPFAHWRHLGHATSRPHNVLLVNKQWLRVGTPALYRTAVLRSHMQARALARAFERHPHFARYLTMLRLEGGYGSPVERIIEVAMTSIVDLCLPLQLDWMDDINATCSVLRFLRPRRLALIQTPRTELSYPKIKCFVRALSGVGVSWDCLNQISLPVQATHVVVSMLSERTSGRLSIYLSGRDDLIFTALWRRGFEDLLGLSTVYCISLALDCLPEPPSTWSGLPNELLLELWGHKLHFGRRLPSAASF
ncbi:hypothetical protein EXIGLDRAFT_834862 [Exidia glandulosa HHB12029]|uniref:F-box domain-containing protein n=1 Tax=Exidia glandulosa HHB12029 TaxID=1314781 RepID=A0A165JCU9_EXIGL|nr:hypothetical protein EXIGLDRAFT_834862 [Exidia glandulosa HHB12029]